VWAERSRPRTRTELGLVDGERRCAGVVIPSERSESRDLHLGWTLLPQRYFTRSSRRRAEFAENSSRRRVRSTGALLLSIHEPKREDCGVGVQPLISAGPVPILRELRGPRRWWRPRRTAPRTPREPRGAAMPEHQGKCRSLDFALRAPLGMTAPRGADPAPAARSPSRIRVPPFETQRNLPGDRIDIETDSTAHLGPASCLARRYLPSRSR